MAVSLKALLLVLLMRGISSSCDENCWWNDNHTPRSRGQSDCCALNKGTPQAKDCNVENKGYKLSDYSYWWPGRCYCFVCIAQPKNTVRLVDANGERVTSTTRGLVQARRGTKWSYVCDDKAADNNHAAVVICRQLGQTDKKYKGTKTIAGGQFSRYGGFNVDELTCHGGEDKWESCRSNEAHDCGATEGFEIQCYTPSRSCAHRESIPGSNWWWRCNHDHTYACGSYCCCSEGYQYHSGRERCQSCTNGLVEDLQATEETPTVETPTVEIVEEDYARGNNILIGLFIGLILAGVGLMVRYRCVEEKVEEMKDEEAQEEKPLVSYGSQAVMVSN